MELRMILLTCVVSFQYNQLVINFLLELLGSQQQ